MAQHGSTAMPQGASFLKGRRDGGPDRVTVLLLPDFSMIAFTALVEPLRLANYISGRTLYEWHLVTIDGLPVAASNGVRVQPDSAAGAVDRPDTVAVIGGIGGQFYRNEAVFARLRRWAALGSHVGALCTGSFALARAGLLTGRRCTVHWECLESFTDAFPDIDCRTALFEIDRDRFSCAGGSAATDMVLSEIAVRHGFTLATAVGDQLMHDHIRAPEQPHRMPIERRIGVTHPKLVQAIQAMERFCEELLDRDDIASRIGVSPRQLERLFRRYLNTSPARYYLKLRLDRAQRLLGTSSLPVSEVAIACGFTSLSHFSKCYREAFGHSPCEVRGRRPRPRGIKVAAATAASVELLNTGAVEFGAAPLAAAE